MDNMTIKARLILSMCFIALLLVAIGAGGLYSLSITNNALKKMRGLNQLGINLNYDINLFIGKNPKYCFLIGIKNQEILNATYTKDFFTL